MTAALDAQAKATFLRWYKKTNNVSEACRRSGISRKSAYKYGLVKVSPRAIPDTHGGHQNQKLIRDVAAGVYDGGGGPIPYDELKPEAKRALEDFEYFRRRYFGRISTPWQIETAKRVIAAIQDEQDSFIVENCPPGAGKSTLVVDIAAWVTCRDRSIRGCIGSRTGANARKSVSLLKRMLEYTHPPKASIADLRAGLAVDAEATLAEDFGPFKPAGREQWTREAFFVAQPSDRPVSDKEATWTAFGVDEGVLGNRFDLVFWDDLVDKKNTSTPEQVQALQEMWDDILETRLEPGGTHMLVGQRIAHNDLYRYCLDKRLPTFDEHGDRLPEEECEPMYEHIVYKAHYPDECEGIHAPDAEPYPNGCLLDPRRLNWRKLQHRMVNDRTWRVQYLQEDTSPEDVLVRPIWIDGGIDEVDGSMVPGCWDEGRGLCELPDGLRGQKFSIAMVDPSVEKYWAFQWIVAVPDEDRVFYLDVLRKKVTADQVLDWNTLLGDHYGIMEDWQKRSHELGLPIRTWIIEAVAAHKHFLQHMYVRDWMRKHRTTIIPHETHRNKTDPDMGVTMLRDKFHYGSWRLPARGGAKNAMKPLVDELTTYVPSAEKQSSTTDQVMAAWFAAHHLPTLTRSTTSPDKLRQRRPSWSGDVVDARLMFRRTA